MQPAFWPTDEGGLAPLVELLNEAVSCSLVYLVRTGRGVPAQDPDALVRQLEEARLVADSFYVAWGRSAHHLTVAQTMRRQARERDALMHTLSRQASEICRLRELLDKADER